MQRFPKTLRVNSRKARTQVPQPSSHVTSVDLTIAKSLKRVTASHLAWPVKPQSEHRLRPFKQFRTEAKRPVTREVVAFGLKFVNLVPEALAVSNVKRRSVCKALRENSSFRKAADLSSAACRQLGLNSACSVKKASIQISAWEDEPQSFPQEIYI